MEAKRLWWGEVIAILNRGTSFRMSHMDRVEGGELDIQPCEYLRFSAMYISQSRAFQAKAPRNTKALRQEHAHPGVLEKSSVAAGGGMGVADEAREAMGSARIGPLALVKTGF